MNTDKNAQAEKAFKEFEDELINDLGLYGEYELLEEKFNKVCIKYNYTELTFYEWLGTM